jgi:hypothetical protein
LESLAPAIWRRMRYDKPLDPDKIVISRSDCSAQPRHIVIPCLLQAWERRRCRRGSRPPADVWSSHFARSSGVRQEALTDRFDIRRARRAPA